MPTHTSQSPCISWFLVPFGSIFGYATMKTLLLLASILFLSGCAGLNEFAEGFNSVYQPVQHCTAMTVGGITRGGSAAHLAHRQVTSVRSISLSEPFVGSDLGPTTPNPCNASQSLSGGLWGFLMPRT